MKLVEFNWKPTDRQLRQFGVICLFALPALAWLWGGGDTLIIRLALTGLGMALAGLVVPVVLKPVFLVLMIVATPIGMVIGELVMLVIFFGVFLPFGLFFRLSGRDPLQLRFERQQDSYWQARKQATSSVSYYRQS